MESLPEPLSVSLSEADLYHSGGESLTRGVPAPIERSAVLKMETMGCLVGSVGRACNS